MGLPSINISFLEKATTAIKRGNRGIVALLLKEDTYTDSKKLYSILTSADIPQGISSSSKEQINLALIGYVNTPKKVLCYFITDQDYNSALNHLLTVKFDYLVAPTAETDGVTDKIATWVKECRKNKKKIKAILPNCKADDEGIINFTTKEMIKGDKKYTTQEYCSRIAGIIAGTPLKISCTYAPLPELDDCSRLSESEMDAAIENGEFILFHDGEKVKVGRGVNSFTTTTDVKGKSFKKIKIIDTMDIIYDDIKKTAEDDYLGKYPNDYDDKCLFMSAINDYFKQLELEGLLSKKVNNNVGIDMEQQSQYIKSLGVKVEEMTEQEIKEYDTDDKVFLTGNMKILDAIEEIHLPISI